MLTNDPDVMDMTHFDEPTKPVYHILYKAPINKLEKTVDKARNDLDALKLKLKTEQELPMIHWYLIPTIEKSELDQFYFRYKINTDPVLPIEVWREVFGTNLRED